MELKLTQYGAGREIGRSCIGLTFPDKTNLLLDAGSKFIQGGVLYPITPNNLDIIDGVIISHSHADHVCALPHFVSEGLFRKRDDARIISNALTKETSAVLLHDAYEIDKSKQRAFYGVGCVVRVTDHLMVSSDQGQIREVKYQLIPSGHIPGASSIMLEFDGKKILYTSDVNYEDTLLIDGSGRLPKADLLIIDSTYGYREHVNRQKTLEDFRQKVLEVIARGGSVVIGVFGVARAQEVMIFLNQLGVDVPIYLDGMAREITDIYLKYPEYVNIEELISANEKIIRIDSRSDRSEALEKGQAIYLATSGMFNGGPVLDFLQGIADDPRSAIIMTGYQANGTGGQQLLREKRIDIRQPDESRKTVEIAGEVIKYGLSAHSDIEGLEKIISHVNPSIVVAQHGKPEAVDAVMKFAESQGRIAYGPSNGDELIFNL
jgi:putative mRNA 3-end processing factor